MILADKADNTTPADYNVDGYNISYGFSVEALDAGIIPYGVGSIAGIVFEDANADGIIDRVNRNLKTKMFTYYTRRNLMTSLLSIQVEKLLQIREDSSNLKIFRFLMKIMNLMNIV